MVALSIYIELRANRLDRTARDMHSEGTGGIVSHLEQSFTVDQANIAEAGGVTHLHLRMSVHVNDRAIIELDGALLSHVGAVSASGMVADCEPDKRKRYQDRSNCGSDSACVPRMTTDSFAP